jgi:crotonobetainyl-CoA:carnitine CoA-transferase CaiB-like acyl-CoA transferase
MEWQAFCGVLGLPTWAGDEKFASLRGRKENEEELNRLVEEWTINFTPEEVMALMQQAGVPAGVVKTNKELFEDPQLRHRNYFQRVEHSEIGQCYQQAWPINLSKSQPNALAHSTGKYPAAYCAQQSRWRPGKNSF